MISKQDFRHSYKVGGVRTQQFFEFVSPCGVHTKNEYHQTQLIIWFRIMISDYDTTFVVKLSLYSI